MNDCHQGWVVCPLECRDATWEWCVEEKGSNHLVLSLFPALSPQFRETFTTHLGEEGERRKRIANIY